MSSTRPRPRHGLLHWLALFAALLQPAAIAPVLLAWESGCGSECCCTVPADEPTPAATVRGCCASEEAPSPAPARERAEGECSCKLQRDDGAPVPAGATPPDASGREDVTTLLALGAFVSAHSELGLAHAHAPAEPSAHAPPGASRGAPSATAPGPWKQLAQRGVDALLAGLGLALL